VTGPSFELFFPLFSVLFYKYDYIIIVIFDYLIIIFIMNCRLFFLKQDGWFEAELSGRLLAASGEDLIRWAYTMMERNHYRNYRITESSPRLCEPPLSNLERGQVVTEMNDGVVI